MKRLTLALLLSFSTFLFFAGCEHAADHDHAGGEADHAQDGEAPDAHVHEGHTVGPNGGDLFYLGNDEADVEIKHDDANKSVVLWITNHDGAPVDAGPSVSMQLMIDGEFVTFELPKVADGKYELANDQLDQAFENADHLQGRLSATIAGKDLTGTMEICGHEAEDHDHAAE